MFSVSQPLWVFPPSWCVCFPCLHCLGSRLFCRELSEAGPGLYALPRFKPLRFRYSGTPQRCRLGWVCVLCPSQVRAAQVTGAWHAQSLRLMASLSLPLCFLGVQMVHFLRCVMCLFWEKAMYSCLESPMDGGAWWAAVQGVTKSWARLGDFPFTFHFHALEKKMATHSSILAWRIPETEKPHGLLTMGSHRVRHG